MKYISHELKYTFKPATRVIDFSADSDFVWSNLYAIVNMTARAQIYGTGISGYGATADSAGKVLTLQYDTTTHSATDSLQFIIDDGNDNLSELLTAAQGRTSSNTSRVLPAGIVTRNFNSEELLTQMLVEQRVTNFLLAQIGNIAESLDDLRDDFLRGN